MSAPIPMSNEDLASARDFGMIAMTSAYMRLMAARLGVEVEDDTEIKGAVPQWLVPINHALTIGWAIYMHDKDFALKSVEELRQHVEQELA